jgi:hypothetical protein
MKKLILPIKYVASILIGIASLGLLIYYIVSFANAFELIKNDWSYIVDYICYFLIFAATAFGAGRGVYLLAKGQEEKYHRSIKDSISAYLLFGLWIAVDNISLYAKTEFPLPFPTLQLITGIFAVISFVALLLTETKKLEAKQHVFNVIFVVTAVITAALYVANNYVEPATLAFSIIGLLALLTVGFNEIYNNFFVKKEETPAVEEKEEK